MGERHLVLLGGAGGIGRAVATRALADGWRVTVMDLPTTLQRHSVDGAAVREIDLSDPASVATAFDGLGPMNGFREPRGLYDGREAASGNVSR